MKKKIVPLSLLIFLVLVVLCMIFLSDSDAPIVEQIISSEEQMVPSEQEIAASEELRLTSIYKEGVFTFYVSQFCDRFADTMPEGYVFADVINTNSFQNEKLYVDILDDTGAPTGIGISFNTKELDASYSQMALAIQEDVYTEDASVMLKWFVSTFLDGFSPGEQDTIYEDCLDMFSDGDKDYRLHVMNSCEVMMNRGIDENDNCYYVIISIR